MRIGSEFRSCRAVTSPHMLREPASPEQGIGAPEAPRQRTRALMTSKVRRHPD